MEHAKLLNEEELRAYLGILDDSFDELSKTITSVLFLNLGDKFIHVLTVPEKTKHRDMERLVEAFYEKGVEAIVTKAEVESAGVITAGSWKDGLMDKIYKIRALLGEIKNGN